MNATEFAAWWGAGVGTLVLAWDVYKWMKHGPQIALSIGTNMMVFGGGVREEGKFVTVRVKNRGDGPTTIENMGLVHYRSHMHRLFRRTDVQMVISRAGISFELPHVLQPGDIWDGRAVQDEELEALANKGYLECHIYCSHAKRPIVKRVKPMRKKSRFVAQSGNKGRVEKGR